MKAEDAIRANGKSANGGQTAHSHVWARDDRDGWRGYVCIACGYSFDLRATESVR